MFRLVQLILLLTVCPPLDALAKDDNTVRIATGEYPPWTSEKMEAHGIINQIVTEAFREVGYKVKYHYMPWNRAIEATRAGKYAATSFWGYSKDRKEDFLFSAPLKSIPFVFFYRKNHPMPDWRELTDLQDFRFGATRGYTYTERFWELADAGKLRVSVENRDEESLQRLVEGTIDVFPLSKETGYYLLNKGFPANAKDGLAVHPKPLTAHEEFILFSRKHPEAEKLLQAFNKGLKSLEKSGEMEALRLQTLQRCCAE